MITAPIRLLLVDDHSVVREALENMLNLCDGLLVVAGVSNTLMALELFCKHQPDVTLLDISMPGMGGIECLRLLRAENPKARVLMLSSSESEQDVLKAFEAGAGGYLVKSASSEELAEAIVKVYGGQRVLSPAMERRLSEGSARRNLTPREIEVLQLLRKGLSNPEIGRLLGVSSRTAKAHVIALFEKLGAGDRTEAVVRAFELGLLKVENQTAPGKRA